MNTEPPLNEPPNHAITDANAYARAIVTEYQAPLTRYAARLLGDADRARDIVQDTFVRLIGPPRADVDGHLAEWLFTVCRHRALDTLRKEGRMTRFTDDQADHLATDADTRPSHTLETEETHAAMLRLIGALPANEQEVIRLKFQNGFSYKEIARITEHSVNHVGVLLHNAIHRLRTDFAAAQES